MESVRKEITLLSGVRIVKTGSALANCLTGMFLSELGAEVARITPEDTKNFLHRGKKTFQESELSLKGNNGLFENAAVVIGDEQNFFGYKWQLLPHQVSCKFTLSPEYLDFHTAAETSRFDQLTGFGAPMSFSFPLPSLIAALYGVNAITTLLIGVKRDKVRTIPLKYPFLRRRFPSWALKTSLLRVPRSGGLPCNG
jgi:hypothetical protein